MSQELNYIYPLFLTIFLAINLLVKSQKVDNNFVDSVKIKKHLNTSGSLLFFLDYGMQNPAYRLTESSSNYGVNGNVNVEIFNVPLIMRFNYSHLKFNGGQNNFFNIKADVQQLRKNALSKIDQYKKNAFSELNGLNKKLDSINHIAQEYESKVNNYSNPDFLNSSAGTFMNKGKDTLRIKKEMNFKSNKYQDSLNSAKDNIVKIQERIDFLQTKMGYIKKLNPNEKVDELSEKELKKMYPNEKRKLNYLGFISGIQSFSIGRCYPSYSEFLINGIPINGADFEYERDNFYFSTTYGTSLNNLFYSQNYMSHLLQNSQNATNFFDTQNILGGNKVFAFKSGWGPKDETHLHAGLLAASNTSESSGFSDTLIQVFHSNDAGKNLVLELDGKLNIYKNHSIYAVMAKSVTTTDVNEDFNSLSSNFKDSNRNHAYKFGYEGSIKNLDVFASGRLIDPFFKSFGIGFLRSNTIRYEGGVGQRFKKISYKIKYRFDKDNLLQDLVQTNTMHSISGMLKWKITRNLNVQGSFYPIFWVSGVDHEMLENDPVDDFRQNNFIGNVLVNWNYRKKEDFQILNFLQYSSSYLNMDSSNVMFSNFSLINQLYIKKNLEIINSFHLIVTNQQQVFNQNAGIWDLTGRFNAGKFTVSLGGRGMMRENGSKDWGGDIGFQFPVYKKNAFLSINGKRLIQGDYLQYQFMNFSQEEMSPYYGSISLKILW